MTVPSSDQVLLGAASLLALTSALIFGTPALGHARASAEQMPRVDLAGTPYLAGAPEAPLVKTETWLAPVAQSRGREWIYDAFTPPEIFYNSRSKQFTVRPPSSLVNEDADEPFGLELVAVRREAFRLQLIGYVGGEGNWRGVCQDLLSGQVFLASGGQRVPALALAISSLDVTVHPVQVGEGMTTRQRVATATIRDEEAGAHITLTHRERVFTGTVFAFVAVPGESATREVRIGDVFVLGAATYHIGDIKSAPPSVDVTKLSPTRSQPDRRVLPLRDADPEGPADEASF